MLNILRRVFSFTSWQLSHPKEPPPGDMLDASFDAQDRKISEIEARVGDIVRSDGKLWNETVGYDQLHPDLRRQLSLKAPKTASNGDELGWKTSEATAQVWSYASKDWAEHMPDTLPDNSVKVMDITGDHWSARWWAHQALKIVTGSGGWGTGGAEVSDVPPTFPNPQVSGRLWWESDTGNLYIWYNDGDSAQWVQIAGGGAANVIVADNQPDPPLNQGQMWWNSVNGSLYCWYDDGDSAQWVQINTNGGAPLTPQMFGATGDGITDDRLALQAWVDGCEATGIIGFLPAGQYRCTGTLYAGRTSSLRIMGIGKTQNAALQQSSTLVFDIADNTHGLIVGASTAVRRDGVEIDGLMIHRATQEPKAGTGVGITYKGIIQGTFRNVTVRNFATGGYVTENGGVCSGCTFDTVRYEGAKKIGCLIDAAIECDFRHGKFGAATGADACLKLQSGSTSPNGNYFRAITLIADDFAPNGADYNLLDVTNGGVFNTFSECAFENGNINNVRTVGGAGNTVVNLIIDNCWFNSSGQGAIYAEDCNIMVTGSRLFTNSVTHPALTIKRVSTSIDFTAAFVQGNTVAFKNGGGITLDGWNGAVISGNLFQDWSGTYNFPAVTLLASANYNVITGNRFRTNTGVNVLSGANNIASNNPQYTTPAVELGPRVYGGPQQTVGGGIPVFQLLGTDGNSPSILQASYRNNSGPPQLRTYKSRGTTVGARGAVQVNDELYHHYVFADEGVADNDCGNLTIFVDAVSAGIVSASWRWATRNAAGTYTERLRIGGDGNVGVGGAANYKFDVEGPIGFTPGASVTPVNNGDVVFQLTSNTQLTIKAKGSDAVIRTANITLA